MDPKLSVLPDHAKTAPLAVEPSFAKGAYSTGKVIVGISTLLMVVILVSGLVIWWPRSRKVLRNRLQVSCTKGWRRFWYDSHVTLGFYSTLFLLVMALTGLTWSFGWYRSFAYGLFGATASSSTSPHSHAAPQEENSTHAKRKGKRRQTIRHGIKRSSMYRPNIPAIPPFVSKGTRYK